MTGTNANPIDEKDPLSLNLLCLSYISGSFSWFICWQFWDWETQRVPGVCFLQVHYGRIPNAIRYGCVHKIRRVRNQELCATMRSKYFNFSRLPSSTASQSWWIYTCCTQLQPHCNLVFVWLKIENLKNPQHVSLPLRRSHYGKFFYWPGWTLSTSGMLPVCVSPWHII